MKRRAILAAPLVLTACGSLLPQQKYVPRINWPLQPAPPAQNPTNPSGPVVQVRPITAAPGMDQQGVQSLLPDGSLNVDYYNLWAVSPADATTQGLMTWLQASGDFSAVIAPGSRLNASLILEGELTELVADPGKSEARAVLTLAVIRNSAAIGASAVPLAQQRITGTAPLTGNTPAAEVAAMRVAFASALSQAVALAARFAT
jgi:cholesterol transport system auxiliary component